MGSWWPGCISGARAGPQIWASRGPGHDGENLKADRSSPLPQVTAATIIRARHLLPSAGSAWLTVLWALLGLGHMSATFWLSWGGACDRSWDSPGKLASALCRGRAVHGGLAGFMPNRNRVGR